MADIEISQAEADALSPSVIEAFRNYQIRPILWKQRIEVVTELAA